MSELLNNMTPKEQRNALEKIGVIKSIIDNRDIISNEITSLKKNLGNKEKEITSLQKSGKKSNNKISNLEKEKSDLIQKIITLKHEENKTLESAFPEISGSIFQNPYYFIDNTCDVCGNTNELSTPLLDCASCGKILCHNCFYGDWSKSLSISTECVDCRSNVTSALP
jgi:hypothetical protein